jgi:hypothetical protein
MTDQTGATVLHAQQPLPPYQPEFAIEQITGYAVSEDGMQCVLRTLTAEAVTLMLIVPTVQVEMMIGALRSAKAAAAAKTIVEAGATAVFRPQTYETIRTPNFDGVLLAFDRGAPSEQVIGLETDAAIRLGNDLRKQGKSAQRLILPNSFTG